MHYDRWPIFFTTDHKKDLRFVTKEYLGQVKLIFSLAGLNDIEDAECGVFILSFMIF